MLTGTLARVLFGLTTAVALKVGADWAIAYRLQRISAGPDAPSMWDVSFREVWQSGLDWVVERSVPPRALPIPEALPERDYARFPLTLSERKALAANPAPLLPWARETGRDGWVATELLKRDIEALRGDLRLCWGEGGVCAGIFSGPLPHLFRRGNDLIAVQITYLPEAQGSGWPDLTDQRWSGFERNFDGYPGYSSAWEKVGADLGFPLERHVLKGGGAASLLRGEIAGTGRVVVSLAANVPTSEVMAQLHGMDFATLAAMVGPVPFGGYDSLRGFVAASLAARAPRDDFVILSDMALREKIAAMSVNEHEEYLEQIRQHAMRKGFVQSDYEIAYRPTGAQGLQDTRDYLTGHIRPDDPRYRVLKAEADHRVPIGTCLQVRAGMFCEDSAETMRIAAELRRLAAARRAAGEARAGSAPADDNRRRIHPARGDGISIVPAHDRR